MYCYSLTPVQTCFLRLSDHSKPVHNGIAMQQLEPAAHPCNSSEYLVSPSHMNFCMCPLLICTCCLQEWKLQLQPAALRLAEPEQQLLLQAHNKTFFDLKQLPYNPCLRLHCLISALLARSLLRMFLQLIRVRCRCCLFRHAAGFCRLCSSA